MTAFLYMTALLFCLAGAGFCSGMESGLVSVNRARLLHWVNMGVKPAQRLYRYLMDLPKCVATLLVGTNLMSVALSTVSASFSAWLFAGRVDRVVCESVWAAGMSVALLYFGEYLPKLLLTTRPLRRTIRLLPVFAPVALVLAPFTRAVLWVTKLILPKGAAAEGGDFLVTRKFITEIVNDPDDGALISNTERTMIHRALRLGDRKARDVMTPIREVASVRENATLGDCFIRVRASGHIRLPVFSRDGTRCVGIFSSLNAFTRGTPDTRASVRRFMRPPVFVRADMPADEILPLLRRSHQHVAVVRDSNGLTQGIVTTDNVLGAVLGR